MIKARFNDNPNLIYSYQGFTGQIYQYEKEEDFQKDLPVLLKEARSRRCYLQVWKDFDGPLMVFNYSGQKMCLTLNYYWYVV